VFALANWLEKLALERPPASGIPT